MALMSTNPCIRLHEKEICLRLWKIYELQCKQEASHKGKLTHVVKLIETSGKLVKILDVSRNDEGSKLDEIYDFATRLLDLLMHSNVALKVNKKEEVLLIMEQQLEETPRENLVFHKLLLWICANISYDCCELQDVTTATGIDKALTFSNTAASYFKRMQSVMKEAKSHDGDDCSTMLVFTRGIYKQNSSLKARKCLVKCKVAFAKLEAETESTEKLHQIHSLLYEASKAN